MERSRNWTCTNTNFTICINHTSSERRESTPGGLGTKLILNVALRKECHVFRQADKYVRLATVEQEEGEEGSLSSVMYLWKVKTVGEADDLEKFLGEGIGGKEDDTAADDKEE